MARKENELRYEPLYKPSWLKKRKQEEGKNSRKWWWAALVQQMRLGLRKERHR